MSDRFKVWFSLRSAASNCAGVASSGSRPPRRNSSSDRARWIEARFLEAASVSASVPPAKSKAARPSLPGIFAPASSHLKRPAIMRWMTRKRSSESSKTMRLPSRRTSRTRFPTAALRGGSKVRTTKGLATRTPVSAWPFNRAASAST